MTRDELVALSRTLGVPIADLLALNPSDDPFYAGTPGQKQKARWFEKLVNDNELVGQHHRDVHYALVSKPTGYKSADWERLQEGSRLARSLGIFPPWAFPDQRSRSVVEDMRLLGGSPAVRLPELHVPGEPVHDEGEWEVGRFAFQPFRIAGYVEKDGAFIQEIVRPFRSYGGSLRVTIGNSARTTAAELCHSALRDGRPVAALWVSDADSSGEGMPNAMARHIEHIRHLHPEVPPIWVDRIALTLAQVEEIEAEIGKKIPRAPDVAREQGRVEINALPFYAPGWLGQEAVRRLDALTADFEVETGLDLPENERLAELHQEALDAYEQIREEMERIAEEAQEIIDGIEPPEFEQPELPEIEPDGDWILDPRRDYLKQLDAYGRHAPIHRRREPLDLTERVCEWCGGPMDGRPVQARFCSVSHQRKASRARRSA